MVAFSMSENNTLNYLLHLAAHVLPGLNGYIGEPGQGDIIHGENNRLQLTELVQHWQHAYPEAGPHYWASRCWTLLIWQPVYLSIFGVQLTGQAPSLTCFGQHISNGFISGFCLQNHPSQVVGGSNQLQFAANQINAVCGHLFNEFNAVLKIHPKMAGRLQADCMLAALIRVWEYQSQMCNATVIDLGRRWLHCAGLDDASALMAVCLDDGQQRLALDRKVCCQHFRRRDGEYCSTCPKLKMDVRIARIRQELAIGDINV